MMRLIFMCLLALAAQAYAQPATPFQLPNQVQQGALVRGQLAPGVRVRVEGRDLLTSPDGRIVFGIRRDAPATVRVQVRTPDGREMSHIITVQRRHWPIQHVNGVAPATVNPPAATAQRIALENARIVRARNTASHLNAAFGPFIWPVRGRISGRFGNQRIFNGTPKAPHSGMDIAAATGTPVLAPADGVVTLAEPGFFLTGGTVVLDHGYGVSSNFLHLSRIDVRVGQQLRQGTPLGAVGATGRATGPHLHWGMSWFDTKIDPLLVLESRP